MFDNLGQVLDRARLLQQTGYRASGAWNLAQTCQHTALWLSFPVRGFPRMPWFPRLIVGAMRLTMGKSILRGILQSGTMAPGSPTIPETVPPRDMDECQAVLNLEQAIIEFTNHAGPLHPSPMFGSMDKPTALRLQLIHASHHFKMLSSP